MNSWFHAQSAAKKWGGTPEEYLPIEEFIDSSSAGRCGGHLHAAAAAPQATRKAY